ncbi:hypothetical protein EYF80_044460 [Liparis tanakae]|uniref:Uncharacterized protein n=1 Tax=Liparis tanakae TaxID=230148 RepID=A0A4Z2FVT1_9TELE|nr:hypothetical protein EYF80_044460 [Liparis tanakae]
MILHVGTSNALVFGFISRRIARRGVVQRLRQNDCRVRRYESHGSRRGQSIPLDRLQPSGRSVPVEAERRGNGSGQCRGRYEL